MAVHAQYAAFPHDPRRAIITRPMLDNAMSASAFLGEPAAAPAANAAFSDLTCIFNGNNACAAPPPPPAKRARVGGDAGLIADLQQAHRALPPPPPQAQVFAAAGDVHQSSSRVLCSGAGVASTSGRPAPAAAPTQGPQGLLLSQLYRHGVVEVDALVRNENERLRAALQEARRRHVAALAAAAERAAARRVRAAEAELARAAARGAELEERLRQAAAEARAWRDAARGHEAVAAGLRAALDDLLAQQQRRSPPPRAAGGEGEGGAEDAESCCFEATPQGDGAATVAPGGGGGTARAACVSCGGAAACVLVLPCRHLCLCPRCDTAVEACPVCAAAKNASLHVLLP
ncbi:unnamed protein product [Urochloa humidicola]